MKKKFFILLIAIIILTACDAPEKTDEYTQETTPIPVAETMPLTMPDETGNIRFDWDGSKLDIEYSGTLDVEYYIVQMDDISRKVDGDRFFTGENDEDRLIEEMKIQAYDSEAKAIDQSIYHNVYLYDFKNDKKLEEVTKKYPQIERLFVFSFDNEEITYIGRLKNLKQLYISNCGNIGAKLSSLWDLKYLEDLELGWIDHIYFDFLYNHPNIKRLTINYSFEGIISTHNLDKLKNLEYLMLSKCKESTIEEISKLEKLKTLYLHGYTGKDLTGLSSLESLEKLSITDYQGDSIDSLKNLTNLKWLSLSRTENITDISPISSLENIEKLYLRDLKNVTSIDALGSLKNLRYVSFENMPNIEDSYALASLTKLKAVNIKGSGFNLQPISQAKCIETINFVKAKNTESISNLINLKSLYLTLDENTELKNVDWLSGLVNLESLTISNNSLISDFSCLEQLKNLKTLGIYGSGIDLDVLEKLDFLEKLEITITDKRDFRYITDMNNLSELRVRLDGGFPSLSGKLKNLKKITILEGEGDGDTLDIEPLCDLKSLESLIIPWMEYTEIDLSPIEKMTQLKELDLDCREATNFPDLSNHIMLEKLYVTDIEDEAFFEKIWTNRSLSFLYIVDCRLSDISQIVNMSNLETVVLFHTNIEDYTPLLQLENLKSLSIGFPIVDEKDLAYFYDIEGLEIEIR
ncbi:MAG: hypothetical protein AB1Z23_02100 [Eubacteriales bacterium]